MIVPFEAHAHCKQRLAGAHEGEVQAILLAVFYLASETEAVCGCMHSAVFLAPTGHQAIRRCMTRAMLHDLVHPNSFLHVLPQSVQTCMLLETRPS